MSLEKLYKELNTLKWLGEDDGWDLAIEAVRARIKEMMKEHDEAIKDSIDCSESSVIQNPK